jgi:SAM-dependent methyltransferase
MTNAELAGVAERVEFRTANMTALPFPDRSFDAVVSHLAVHHLRDRLMRATALTEMLRVTRPGAKLRIADVRFVDEYAEDLHASGATDVTVKRLGPSGWYDGPFRAARLLSASRHHSLPGLNHRARPGGMRRGPPWGGAHSATHP